MRHVSLLNCIVNADPHVGSQGGYSMGAGHGSYVSHQPETAPKRIGFAGSGPQVEGNVILSRLPFEAFFENFVLKKFIYISKLLSELMKVCFEKFFVIIVG